MKGLKKFFSEKGFSLTEGLVGAALIGGVSIAALQLVNQSAKIESSMTVNQEVNSLAVQMKAIIAKAHNCTSAVKNKKIGDQLTGIYIAPQPVKFNDPTEAESGDRIYSVNQELGNRRIKITDLRLVTKETNGINFGDFVRVNFQYGTEPEIVRDFPFRATKNPDGSFNQCYSQFATEVLEGMAQICKSLEGTWNEENMKCYPTQLPVCFLTDEASCGTVGSDDGTVYVDKGSQDFTQYDYTVCTTEFKRKKEPKICRFGALNLADEKCKCMGKGCSCLAPERNCTSRWMKGPCYLEFKVKKMINCCRKVL